MASPRQAVPALVLYKLGPAWDLPSSSAACIQVEAYLRLAKAGFVVQETAGPAASPTGQLPALDVDGSLLGHHAGTALPEDFEAAQAVIASLRAKGVLLQDGSLAAEHRADLLAYTLLVRSSLERAILYTSYCEAEAFSKHTRAMLGKELAFPLNYLLPQIARKDVRHRLASATTSQVYEDAVNALSAISNRLKDSTGPLFFGSLPTSLDCLLFGCLVYLKAAPVVHPDLQKELDDPALVAYVEHISTDYFSSRAPSAGISTGMQWSQWKPTAEGGSFATRERPQSERDLELQRKGRTWLLVAAGAIAAYIILGGQYLTLELNDDDFGGSEDDDE